MYCLNIDPENPQGNPTASELRSLGVEMARFTFKDYSAGSYPSQSKIDFYTRKAQEYSAAGISSLIILSYETYPGKPAFSHSDALWNVYINHLAQRAAQLAQIFSPWQPAFQIWNEPDLLPRSGYEPSLREAVYGRMLVRVYNAIKSVNATLPVIGAGLASGNPTWWQQTLASQGGSIPLDANAIHPYGQRPQPNWPSSSWGFGYVGNLIERYLQVSNHPLWITEIGVSQLNANKQAEYLHLFYNTITHVYAANVKQVFWFCYSDGMVSPFGLRDSAGRPKPAYNTFLSLAAATPPPAKPYGVQYTAHNTPESAIAGQNNMVSITLRNTGTRAWTTTGEHPFRMGYHWYNSDGSETPAHLWEDYRANLPHRVPPNGLVTLNCKLGMPRLAGSYEVRWDMVEEMVTWFSWQGVKTLNVQVDVKQNIAPPPEVDHWRLSASHNNVQQGPDNLQQAIDNNPYTRWSTQSPQRPGMWFQIDLGKVTPLSHISLDNASSPQDYPRGYIVKTSTDGHTWDIVARNKRNTAPLNVMFSQRSIRFIRIEQSGSDPDYWWSIHRIDVSNQIQPVLSASHNNVLVGNDNLLQAIDGRLDTRWSSWALQRPGMWFEIDLRQTRIIKGLTLDNAASPYDYPRGYVALVSTDHRQWQEVARKDPNDRPLDINFRPRSVRYIRIEQTGSANFWWSIYEITLKTGGDSPPEADFGLKASHHNVLSGGDNVLQAADGNPVTRWSSHAAQQPGMWFEIDLKKLVWVNALILDNAASPNDYPRGYAVFFSVDRAHWMEVARNERNSGPLDISFNRQCARYIKIEQTGHSDTWWWSIHEIHVASQPVTPKPPVSVTARASHNNVTQGADNLRQMLDGNAATRWSSRIPQRPGMWLELDLNDVSMVRGLILDSAASPNDYPRAYVILVSTDRLKWVEVARNNNNSQAVNIRFRPHCARYILIRQIGQSDNWWWSVHRVGIIS